MIEKEFLDRVPTYPGRVTLIPVSGQANTYDMARSDSPRVAGTALDKATFDSVVQSRLTGRYYAPTMSRNIYSSQSGIAASPIPTSGWVYDTTTSYKATSGAYTVEASGSSYNDEIHTAFLSTGWESTQSLISWIQISHAQAIKVRKMTFRTELQGTTQFQYMEIQGSNDGAAWTPLLRVASVTEGSDVEYALSTTGEYLYYRIYFSSTSANRITVSRLAYTLYDINTYTNAFTVASGFPTAWDVGQRVMISTPSTINPFAVVANTLNGITINTILQQNKRYELRYTGSAFVAKEV